MLKLTEIKKAFGNVDVLNGVSLTCAPGETVCIAGANGAGKTTLLSIAAGLVAADAGDVQCGGRIGYLSQEPALLSELSVKDNLILWYAAYHRAARTVFSQDAPETTLGLRPYARRKISKLSGGLRKRAAIACALVGEPAFLLMDEPFAALDLQSRAEMLELLCALKQQGKGLLLISHDPKAITALADRVVLLKNGLVLAEETILGEQEQRKKQVIELLSEA